MRFIDHKVNAVINICCMIYYNNFSFAVQNVALFETANLYIDFEFIDEMCNHYC